MMIMPSSFVFAQEVPDRVLSNSEDWRDVYSVVLTAIS